jgi:hypothetical protein
MKSRFLTDPADRFGMTSAENDIETADRFGMTSAENDIETADRFGKTSAPGKTGDIRFRQF